MNGVLHTSRFRGRDDVWHPLVGASRVWSRALHERAARRSDGRADVELARSVLEYDYPELLFAVCQTPRFGLPRMPG